MSRAIRNNVSVDVDVNVKPAAHSGSCTCTCTCHVHVHVATLPLVPVPVLVLVHVLVLVLVWILPACGQRGGGPPTRAVVPTTVLDPNSGSGTDTVSYRPGPASFPVPKDAETVEDTPPDHTYKIARRQSEVLSELKVNLAQMGFKIEDEYVEDVAHTHWYITRDAVTYRVSIAGDDQGHTLIILTVD